MAARISSDSTYFVRDRAIEFTESVFDHEWIWPLMSRAWAFQERRLSRRSLHFSIHQVVFECRTFRRSEDGESNLGAGVLQRFDILPADVTLSHMVKLWHNIITAYSKLDMTYESDRLAALAALARRMHSFRKTDVYFAGMWRDTLLHDLRWYAQGDLQWGGRYIYSSTLR